MEARKLDRREGVNGVYGLVDRCRRKHPFVSRLTTVIVGSIGACGAMAQTGLPPVALSSTTPPPSSATATSAASSHIVTPSEQAERDRERTNILRQELAKSEALLESLGRRKAERQAAADPQGAQEIEEQRERTVQDIAGLKRELMTPAAAPVSEHPASQEATGTRVAAAIATRSASAAAPARWWDVYSKGSADRSTPSALPAPPAPPGAFPVPGAPTATVAPTIGIPAAVTSGPSAPLSSSFSSSTPASGRRRME